MSTGKPRWMCMQIHRNSRPKPRLSNVHTSLRKVEKWKGDGRTAAFVIFLWKSSQWRRQREADLGTFNMFGRTEAPQKASTGQIMSENCATRSGLWWPLYVVLLHLKIHSILWPGGGRGALYAVLWNLNFRRYVRTYLFPERKINVRAPHVYRTWPNRV